jgi:hypothetical protein
MVDDDQWDRTFFSVCLLLLRPSFVHSGIEYENIIHLDML